MRRVALVALVACSPPGIPGEIVTRGRHVELHADPALPVCAASVEHVDDFIEATAELLGVPAPQVTYYLYDGVVEGCRILAGSGEVFDCASGTTVYAAVWPHYHELVHAVAGPWGRPPAFLVEGLAEGLGGQYPRLTPGDRATAELALDSVDFYATNVAAHYLNASDFAIYLLRRFGATKLRALSTSLLYLSDPITLDRRFSEITGNTLETVIAAWRTSDPPDGPPQPADGARCNAPPADDAGPDAWSVHASDDCAVELVDQARLVRATTFHSIDVATPGLYQFSAALGASVEPSFTVEGCGTDDASPFIDYAGPTSYYLFPLAAGRHSVEHALFRRLSAAAPIDVDWSLSRTGEMGATCETAAVFAAPQPDFTVSLDSTPSHDWPGLDSTGTNAVTWLRIDGASTIASIAVYGATALACTGPCDALASCVSVSQIDQPAPFAVPAGQPLYLELTAAVTQTGNALATVRGAQNTMPIRGPNAIARSRLPRSD